MLGNLLQTQFLIFIYLFYICSLIIFFHFTSVWLDNLDSDLQKGWALTAVTEVKTARIWARAMFNSLKKTPNLKSDEIQSWSWNPKWVNSFYTSFSSLPATACRRGTAAHFHITKMKCKWTYCLPSTCVVLWWALIMRKTGEDVDNSGFRAGFEQLAINSFGPCMEQKVKTNYWIAAH